jgi:hypothetical protein
MIIHKTPKILEFISIKCYSINLQASPYAPAGGLPIPIVIWMVHLLLY